jgi:hypothetical protein
MIIKSIVRLFDLLPLHAQAAATLRRQPLLHFTFNIYYSIFRLRRAEADFPNRNRDFTDLLQAREILFIALHHF